ncbi:MAG: methyltransferase [Terriglobales bacterium]
MLPVRLGTPEEFAVVRSFLAQSGYNLPAICARLRISLPYDFTRLHPGPGDTEPADLFELLVRLFLLGETISAASLGALVPENAGVAMAHLGLIAQYGPAPERVWAPVALCPIEDLYLVSDRWSPPDSNPWQLPVDAVYPALTYNTQHFLRNLSQRPCERMLDLCTGSGVAALLAAGSYAKQVIATDVAEPSLQATEFNIRLNGLTNTTARQSDVYNALTGETFDCIVAHPPFVPVLQPKWVYHDGGRDGEEITRRIISGLPAALRPGGVFQCHTMATDRDAPLEERLREWLGEAHSDFDILVVVWKQLDPVNFAAEMGLKGGGGDEFETWKKLFTEWRVERLLDVSITLRRHAEALVPLTLRRSGGSDTAAGEADWLLDWERIMASGHVYQHLLPLRPRISQHLQVAVVHRMQEGELRVADCKAAVDYPFNIEASLDPWMPTLLAACNGTLSINELCEVIRQTKNIPADTPPERFAALVAAFISRGFLYLDEFAPPRLRPAPKAAAAQG